MVPDPQDPQTLFTRRKNSNVFWANLTTAGSRINDLEGFTLNLF